MLMRLRKEAVTLNEKCEFSKRSVRFFEQVLDESGDSEKVQAITYMSKATNPSEVRRFRGTINHLGKFLPSGEDTAFKRSPSEKKNMWAWGEQEQRAHPLGLIFMIQKQPQEPYCYKCELTNSFNP